MPKLTFAAVVIASLAAACGSHTTLEAPFEQVAMERTSGLGFCPSLDTWSTVTLVQRADGQYDVSGAAIRSGDPGVDECIGYEGDPCYVAEAVEPFALTAEQSTELNDLLHAIPRETCDIDEAMDCDPCLITTFTVDELQFDDTCCGDWMNGAGAAITALAAFLDGLVPG